MSKLKKLGWFVYILLVIGGLVHLGQSFNYYLIDKLPGWLGTIIYLLVGLAGLIGLISWIGLKK
jgi:uncharacterized membrane protein YuzA (DUF378 family)